MTTQAVAPVDAEIARTLYTLMRRAESLDERLRRGILRGEFLGVIWPSRGQEAIAAGMGAAVNSDDRLITTYRGLHDMVGKGVPLEAIIGEVLGHTVGASGGKGGTMHIASPESGLVLTTGIVGAGVPIAVGVALAARRTGSNRVTAVCFGDGATNTGSFHEGMNLAALWQLPIIFICQNNLWAEMTPIADTMHIKEVRDRALAYGMVNERIDGNDPEAVYHAVAAAAERGRSGGGPTFLECVTFRFAGHFVGDPQPYMPAEELAGAQANDPIPRYRQKLLDGNVLSSDELTAIDDATGREVEDAVRAVVNSPRPDSSELDRDFYADMKGVPS